MFEVIFEVMLVFPLLLRLCCLVELKLLSTSIEGMICRDNFRLG